MKLKRWRTYSPADIFPRIAGVALLGLGLNACTMLNQRPADYTYTGTTHTERHPISVNAEIKSLRFEVTPGVGALTHAQERSLHQFIATYRASSKNKLKLEAPATQKNRSAVAGVLGDIAAHFRAVGITPNEVVYKKYNDPSIGDKTPIILSYQQHVARVPTCGNWSVNLAKTYENKPMPNLGCAQQSNLAAMVSDPRDLLGPRALTPADFERRSVVIDKYRQGEVTSSARSDEESGKVSEVGE